MNRRKSLKTLRKTGVFAAAMASALACTACSANSKEEEHTGAEDSLSLENALAIAESEDAADKMPTRSELYEEAMQFYNENNALAANPDAECNQGKEALIDFVRSFLDDKAFRASRINLPAGVKFEGDALKPYTLRVLQPDSTGFFASWNYVGRDSASFLSGWLNSEVLEELTLVRHSPDDKWRLVDYFGGM